MFLSISCQHVDLVSSIVAAQLVLLGIRPARTPCCCPSGHTIWWWSVVVAVCKTTSLVGIVTLRQLSNSASNCCCYCYMVQGKPEHPFWKPTRLKHSHVHNTHSVCSTQTQMPMHTHNNNTMCESQEISQKVSLRNTPNSTPHSGSVRTARQAMLCHAALLSSNNTTAGGWLSRVGG